MASHRNLGGRGGVVRPFPPRYGAEQRESNRGRLARTNNIGARVPAGGEGAKASEITDGLKAVLDVCREKAPGAEVDLMGITPRNDNLVAKAVIDKVDERLGRLADGKKVRYLNINEMLTGRDGKLLDGMSPDRLHLSVKGYQG